MPTSELGPGVVAWAQLDPVRGREQAGHRPVVIVSSLRHLHTVTALAIVVPLTTVDRGWGNHVKLAGAVALDRESWAMTEQPRTISRDRLGSLAGRAHPRCLAEIRVWLADFLDFSPR